MPALSVAVSESRPAWERLNQLMEALQEGAPKALVASVEHEVARAFAAAQAEFVGTLLQRSDVNAPRVMIDGVLHRRVGRSAKSLMTLAGPVVVERALYTPMKREPGTNSVSALELRVGVVSGFFTPASASAVAWAGAHLVPREVEELFRRTGQMAPSRSSIDRLMKSLSTRWEDNREQFETAMTATISIPEGTASVAASLDGTMIPMSSGAQRERRAQQKAEDKKQTGPVGYKEASVATLSFLDVKGQVLSTIRHARMPETRKRALKAALLRDMTQVHALAPQLPIVKVADGVDDNWTFLKNAPGDIEVIDFFHACEHFYDALATAWGTTRARAEFPIWRDVLRDCTDGVVVIVSLLRKLRRAFPRRTKVRRALGYFVRNRRRMQYATTRARGLPIASGVVEAACKTVVASRMRRAGMRWSMAGGQALLTLRAAALSGNFDGVFELAAPPRHEVEAAHLTIVRSE